MRAERNSERCSVFQFGSHVLLFVPKKGAELHETTGGGRRSRRRMKKDASLY